MTELEVVNDILRATGDSPVNSINSSHPSVTAIRTQIKRAVVKIQRRGFWFNTEYKHEFQPTNSRIVLPSDVASIVPVDPDVIMRGQDLYHRGRNSYLFDAPVVVTSLIRTLSFDQLPESAKDAVKYTAGVEYIRDSLGDVNLMNEYKALAGNAMVLLLNEDLESEQLNAFSSPTAMKMRRGVRPYRGLW